MHLNGRREKNIVKEEGDERLGDYWVSIALMHREWGNDF